MQIMSGVLEGLPQGVYSQVARYRHKVFIEQLGWQLRTQDGAELDQFDRQDTVYVVARDDKGHVFGCARLLPTTRPYLLGEVFPHLLNGFLPPCSSDVWELSRFAAVDLKNQASAVEQSSSPVAITLLQKSIACAAEHGAKRLITVSPIGVERLLRRAGFHAHRAGPPMVIDGHPVFACWIEIDGNGG